MSLVVKGRWVGKEFKSDLVSREHAFDVPIISDTSSTRETLPIDSCNALHLLCFTFIFGYIFFSVSYRTQRIKFRNILLPVYIYTHYSFLCNTN